MNLWRKLRNDECGGVVSAELVLVGTLMVIGILPGIVTVRDAILTELADLAAAISAADFTIESNDDNGGEQ